MIQYVHNETQEDGGNYGGAEGTNVAHPNHAQLTNTATACLNAVEYHLSHQLRLFSFPMIHFRLITSQQTLEDAPNRKIVQETPHLRLAQGEESSKQSPSQSNTCVRPLLLNATGWATHQAVVVNRRRMDHIGNAHHVKCQPTANVAVL